MKSVEDDLDYYTIESKWDGFSEEEKSRVIQAVAGSDPELAIIAVLAGIKSFHFPVRNDARKGLEHIRLKILTLLADPEDKAQYLKGMKASASVCYRIYSRIQPDIPQAEIGYFFKTLLLFEGYGPYFAYMAVYKKIISTGVMEQLMNSVSDDRRLALVDQYVQAFPSVRVKFGASFGRLLKSVKQRDAVICFYASLFDRQRDADPFLNNISFNLRDPDKIMAIELNSQSPEIKIRGLKALAMISDRISPDLLITIISAEEVRKVRLAIYQIIENSSRGTYAELFYPILNLFYRFDLEEALQAFKALVVSGKIPLYTLLEMVRKDYPSLMLPINREVSTLSRISFFVIQDISLNKEKYQGKIFDVNLACVLGMMKKRPERVIKLLKTHDHYSRNTIQTDVLKFIEKTKNFLSQEKQSIETEFEDVIQQVRLDTKSKEGFFRTWFKNPNEKKIELLRDKKHKGDLHFDGETIRNVNLSSFVFQGAAFFFNHCIFDNCDVSESEISRAFFKKTIFYNIDMQKTQFDGVNFDHAVFINVNAQGALFKKCSFQKVSIFNCNFNNTQMTDIPFLNAVISKTSFNQADLSCSFFAYSRISGVSFIRSNMDQTDFSGVNAKFSRFPSDSRALIRTENMDYNARKFQLSFEDMPRMDQAIVSEINMLIVAEFIHYGEMKFLKQNKISLLTAFDIFSKKQADLFQIIPYLVHENFECEGIQPLDPHTPYGIHDYLPAIEIQDVLKPYSKKGPVIIRRCATPSIEGVFTMGSIGSIAQTGDSDIDYWICINEAKLDKGAVELLRKKLDMIECMARDRFGTQVTFFIVDIVKAKNNDFGDSTMESSGSAQSRLLKEEFYRTMIHVAGKIPLWSVLPTPISVNFYNRIIGDVSNFPNLTRYIDLGDIHAIPTSEYCGASIWQMFKWLKSPFKSVIKMTLLEKYIFEYGKEPLLCNKYKDEWMNSGTQLKLVQNDSYYILLKNLIRYFETFRDKETVHLLLTCFFLKLGISKDSEIDNTVFGLRRILLEHCMLKWGWSKHDMFEIGSFKTWPYSDIVKLSGVIEKFMIQKYKTVNIAFERNFQGGSAISLEDRTVLGRKILVEFSKQSGKIGKVLLISRSDRHFQGLQLRYVKNANNTGTWELINRNAKSHQNREEFLITAPTIEEIGAWLITNGLYNENTMVHLIPNPTHVTSDDIRKLYKALYEFFQPALKKEIGFDKLLLKPRVVYLFISINFSAPRQQRKVTEYTAVYLNSWGEIFCQSFFSDPGFFSLEEAKKDIMDRISIKKLPLNTVFYFSKGVVR